MNSQLRGFVVAASMAAVGCSDSPRDHAAGEALPSGVSRITNDLEATWEGGAPWSVREEWRIGNSDSELAMPVSLVEDAAERLYVLDAQANEVLVFGSDGRHVRSFGRAGAGPGEFARPVAIVGAPDGTIWSVDPGNVRLTAFDTAGTMHATHARFGPFMMMPWPGGMDADGRLYDVVGGVDLEGVVVIRFRPGAARADTIPLPSFDPPSFRLDARRVQTRARVPFTPELVWAIAPDGRLWTGVTDRYRLTVRGASGAVDRVVELAVPPVPVSAAERSAAVDALRWFTDQGGRIDASRIPGSKPAFRAIRLDDYGYAWISPAQAENDPVTHFDVFQPLGGYVGRVAVPIPPHQPDVLPVLIRGDRIYVAAIDQAGFPYVARFRISGRSLPPHGRATRG